MVVGLDSTYSTYLMNRSESPCQYHHLAKALIMAGQRCSEHLGKGNNNTIKVWSNEEQ